MFRCAMLMLFLAVPAVAAVDAEAKKPYQLRVVLRTAEHPTLTPAFRADVAKQVRQMLQNALGGLAAVEVVDLAGVAAEKRDPLWQLAAEKGLDALDGATAVTGVKTHFLFVDIADGQYELRLRQHDGSTGTASPLVRTLREGDRASVSRVAARAIGADFGFVGTFDPAGGGAVAVPLKAGELGPVEAWVKKGDVFAVVQVREARRPAKGKEAAPALTGQRLDGVLLQVQDAPRNGVAVCKLHARYRGGLPRDGATVGYRAVKLGTAETPVKLRLTDGAGNPLKGSNIRVRAAEADFPADATRDREELVLADGVYTSKEPLKNLAFVVVTSNDAPVARIPLELFAHHTATRKVTLDPKADAQNDAADRARDMLDRVRGARVVLARTMDELSDLQRKDKPKALEYAEAAAAATDKEAAALKADIARLKERLGKDAPPGAHDAADADLRALAAKNAELKAHIAKLKDVIRLENDPAAMAKRKAVDGLLLDAKLHINKADYGQAIEKYREAIKASADEPAAKAELETALAQLEKDWEVKDDAHAAARKFVYDTWPKWDTPAEMRDGLPEAKKAVAKCQAVRDLVTLRKFYLTGPQVLERYGEAMKKLTDAATEDEDKAAVRALLVVGEELEKLLMSAGKALGADGK